MRELFAFFLFFLILVSFRGTDVHHTRGRIPASLQGHCYRGLTNFTRALKPDSRFFSWKRWLSIPENRFDLDLYNDLITQYENALRSGENFTPDQSSEGLLAYIKATVRSRDLDDSGMDLKLNLFREGKLEALHQRLLKRGKLESARIEDLTAELFTTAFGPEVSFKKFLNGDELKKKLILRVVQQDLVDKGLLGVFFDYRLTKNNPTFLQKFRSTIPGKAAMTGILNLPVLAGAPPLYLPGFGPIRLSEGLSGELLDKGLSDDVLRRIDMEIGHSLTDKARFNKIKSYYVSGVMIYITLASIYDSYQLNKDLDEEAIVLDEALGEIEELVRKTEVLENSGINVFSDEELEEGRTFCDAISSCLKSVGVSEGETEAPAFTQCKQIMDPDNRCKRL